MLPEKLFQGLRIVGLMYGCADHHKVVGRNGPAFGEETDLQHCGVVAILSKAASQAAGYRPGLAFPRIE